MENKTNKLIAAHYQLFTINDNGERKLVEETSQEQPFVFITGFGAALDALEEKLQDLERGAKFDFELDKDQAFGEYEPKRVIDLNKEMFCIDGHFDSKNIFKGAQIPLKNEDGNFFIATVLEIGDSKVKVDLNHPLAGNRLNFKGYIIENREATKEEMQTTLQTIRQAADNAKINDNQAAKELKQEIDDAIVIGDKQIQAAFAANAQIQTDETEASEGGEN